MEFASVKQKTIKNSNSTVELNNKSIPSFSSRSFKENSNFYHRNIIIPCNHYRQDHPTKPKLQNNQLKGNKFRNKFYTPTNQNNQTREARYMDCLLYNIKLTNLNKPTIETNQRNQAISSNPTTQFMKQLQPNQNQSNQD